jgi:hypothetical protein
MGRRVFWNGKDMNSPLSGVGFLSFAIPLRRVALMRKTRTAMLHKS